LESTELLDVLFCELLLLLELESTELLLLLELESTELLLLEDDLQSGGITALDVLELSILLLEELEKLLLDELSRLLELDDEFNKAYSPHTTNVEQMTISRIPPILELEL
jgi:hypothetical protein